MTIAIATAGKLKANALFRVADQDPQGPLSKISTEVISYAIGTGVIALIATCIRVWAGMDVIQTQITALAKSDSRQDQTIEQVRAEINTLRVQVGVLRAIAQNNK
ncbi:MAG: hypothetical protein ACO242_04165 [Candidatus Fonsibacter ubiquis]